MAKLEELFTATATAEPPSTDKAIKEKVMTDTLGTKEAEEIKERVAATHLQAELMVDEGKALYKWGIIDKEQYFLHESRKTIETIKEAAAMAGADPAQMANMRKRTPEQERLLLEVAGQKELDRITTFIQSIYGQALAALVDEKGKCTDTAGTIKQQATIYFFALHSEIDITAAIPLTESQEKELKTIYSRLDKFYIKKAKEKGINLKQDISGHDNSILYEFINEEHPKKKEAEKLAEEIRVKAKAIKKPLFPIDVLNNNVFRKSFIGDKVVDGKTSITCTINFKELEGITITDKLSPFDKEVHRATYDLYRAGNEYFSIAQIHKAMGNDTRPSTNQIKKINDSLTKMGMARIFIDNDDETKIYKKYRRYRYDGALLPFERVQGGAYINGVFTEAVIHLFREPPLFTFAMQRKQILTIPKVLLAAFPSQTETNLQIRDYLLVKINAIKKKAIHSKITWETLFNGCDITTRLKKFQTKEKVKNCIEYFKEHDYIKGYRIDEESITIIC